MLISPLELQANWNVNPRSVLHVGAHEGEEAPLYEALGWKPVIWIEAQPELIKKLQNKFSSKDHEIIEATVWDESGITMNLHLSSNSQSTSLLNFGSHAKSYPHILNIGEYGVVTKRIDELIQPDSMPDFINLDIQGVELRALQGLGELVHKLNYIYLEVNWRQVYKGCARVWQVDKYLGKYGFRRVTTRWYVRAGWGDALYLPRNAKRRTISQRRQNLTSVIRFYSPQFLALAKKVFPFNRRRFSDKDLRE